MALPTLTKTWTISPCNRIAYVSLLDTLQKYFFGIKNFLKANGYTVKGSSGAGAGGGAAMDGVDRWVTSANVTPRGATTTTAQAWIVLTSSGSGVDILLAYQGATDDAALVALSTGGSYVLAGTATHQPTATDAQTVIGATSIISTGVGDRLWSGWVSTDAKSCRFALARAGVWLGYFNGAPPWGVEHYTSVMIAPVNGLPAANPTAGFNYTAAAVSTGNDAGTARVRVANADFTTTMQWGAEYLFTTASLALIGFGAEKPELQGSLGYPLVPLTLYGTTAGARGRIGDAIDVWMGRTSGDSPGDTYGTRTFIVMPGGDGLTTGTGLAWPWDGSVPVMT